MKQWLNNFNNWVKTEKKSFVKKTKEVGDNGYLKKNYKQLLYPWLIIVSLLVVLPLVILIFYSIYDVSSGSFILLTFSNYISIFSSSSVIYVIFISFVIGLFSTIFSLFIGYPVAYYLSEISNKNKKTAVLIIVTMPIWINMLIRIISMQLFLQNIAPEILGSYFAVILGMVYTYVPFMILPIYISLNNRDRDLERAARDLGSSSAYTFRKITFVNSLPAIYSGSLMVLLPSMTSITVTRYMSNGSINNIGNVLENLFVTSSNYTYGAAVAVFTLIVMALITVGISLITKQRNTVKGKKDVNDEQ